MTIKIKAPRSLNSSRLISEATYRRILALVRTCDESDSAAGLWFAAGKALAALRAQCAKENKRG